LIAAALDIGPKRVARLDLTRNMLVQRCLYAADLMFTELFVSKPSQVSILRAYRKLPGFKMKLHRAPILYGG